jgi:hypothetical protein
MNMKIRKLISASIVLASMNLLSCKKEYKCICTTIDIDYVTKQETEQKEVRVYKERKRELAKKYCDDYGNNCQLQ